MMSETQHIITSPFNSPLETATRSLILLVASYPLSMDLQRLSNFDYLLVHSGDVGGPDSLHPPLPYRTGEILVRRRIIQEGLHLLISRGLVDVIQNEDGFEYQANEEAQPAIDLFSSPYILDLKDRANWAINQFSKISQETFKEKIRSLFNQHTAEFISSPISDEII